MNPTSYEFLSAPLWLITLLLLISSVVLAVALPRLFAHPIRPVTGAARELAAGNLEVTLPIPSHDEIGELTIANRLLKKSADGLL